MGDTEHERDEGRERLTRIWPLFGLRVVTPRLELRYPTDADGAAIADLAADGVHDPAAMPFTHPWTDVPPPRQQVVSLQHHWKSRAEWTADAWHLLLAVAVDGEIVGVQGASATQFPVLRQVVTGSWLGRANHRRGIGTEMRHAIAHLAFAGLGAVEARSAALEGNEGSLGVSRKLGYEPDGTDLVAPRGEAVRQHRLLLTRERWSEHRRDDIAIEGLEPCLGLFGLDAAPHA